MDALFWVGFVAFAVGMVVLIGTSTMADEKKYKVLGYTASAILLTAGVATFLATLMTIAEPLPKP